MTWIDAYFDLDEEPRPITAHSVGWVASEGENHVTVASERFENGLMRGYTSIPRGCIVEVQEIAEWD